MLDIHANHGNSGGPVFSRASGAVIGIQVGVAEAQVDFSDKALGIPHGFQVGQDGHPIGLHPLSYNSGIAQVISVSHIIQLLKQNGIGFESEQ